jgi:hypothetical protein
MLSYELAGTLEFNSSACGKRVPRYPSSVRLRKLLKFVASVIVI